MSGAYLDCPHSDVQVYDAANRQPDEDQGHCCRGSKGSENAGAVVLSNSDVQVGCCGTDIMYK